MHREIAISERNNGVYITRNGRKLLSFSCNDYFGLSQHPRTIEASIKATQIYGTGSGASRLITGSNPLYDRLERKLAEIKGTEDACVFGSGYLANIGTITALLGTGDLIVADKLCHACIIDGAGLSKATMLRFKHNDIGSLRRLLEKNRKNYKNCLIITETIFSMDGDFSPVDEIVALAQEFDCWTMTDDAHGLGITTPNNKIDIQMGTLSKGAGSYGGYICGTKEILDYIRNKARALIYSTALPPATIAAASEALDVMTEEPERVGKPVELCSHFAGLLGEEATGSTIFPLIIGKEEDALSISKKLNEAGYLVSAIRPPTVPPNTSRLRFTFSYLHKKEQVEELAGILKGMIL